MSNLHNLTTSDNSLATIRERAARIGNHPNATADIASLSRIIGKTCDRVPYDPDAALAAMVFYDRLERLAAREHFEPEIFRGAFRANRRAAA